MKLYIEKFEKQTVVKGRLFALDSDELRETYSELRDLSDDEIVQTLRDDPSFYDVYDDGQGMHYEWNSAEKGEDSTLSVMREVDALNEVQWELWSHEYPTLCDANNQTKQQFLKRL